LQISVTFDEVTGLDIPYTHNETKDDAQCRRLLKIFIGDPDERSMTLRDGSYSSNASNTAMHRLLQNAAGLDADAMEEEQTLERIKEKKKADALRARPHFIRCPDACTCIEYVPQPYVGTSSRKKQRMRMHQEMNRIREHSNCKQKDACDLVKFSKTPMRSGYKWEWKLKKYTNGPQYYGQHLIDKRPVQEPTKSKKEQAEEDAKNATEAADRKLARDVETKCAVRRTFAHLLSHLKSDVNRPNIAYSPDF
jgi:hypothetical protein